MSPFPLFLSILLSFIFSQILHQWYFLYLRITGQNKTHRSITYTSAVRGPATLEDKIQWGGGVRDNYDKVTFLPFIPTVLVGKQLAQCDGKQDICKASTWTTTLAEGGV